MGKRMAAVGMAAAIGVGGLTVAAVNPLGIAGAQDAPAASTTSTSAPKHEGPLARALAKLVEDGTLTQTQADKVLETTKAEAKAGKAERKEQGQARRAETLAVIGKALGSTPEDVKAALEGGTSIADQAKAAGVDRAVVEEALAKHLTARIDAAVADGKITEERAAKAKEHVDQAVDRIIDAKPGSFGKGGFRERLRERRGN